MVTNNEDCKVGFSIFYLDGKRMRGFDGHAYLVDECGFSNEEAVQYLCLLSALDGGSLTKN